MPTAYIFPGQGAQFVGMARDLTETYDSARAIVDRASTLLGFDIDAVMYGDGLGPDEAAARLRRTDNTQPALFVHSMAAWSVLRERGVTPDCTAGHSLGEYSALVAAGAISFEDGMMAVRRRGELMADANRVEAGTMLAVIGLDDDAVNAVCDRVERETDGVVRPANYNSPGQVVISGSLAAIDAAAALATEAGARKVVPLDVGGAFHSPLMAYAAEGLSEALNRLELRKPMCPVVLNVTAEPTTDPEMIRALLLEQLVSPVRWTQSVVAMHEQGIDRFVEVGPGKILSGLVKRILDRNTATEQAGTVDDLERLYAADWPTG